MLRYVYRFLWFTDLHDPPLFFFTGPDLIIIDFREPLLYFFKLLKLKCTFSLLIHSFTVIYGAAIPVPGIPLGFSAEQG